MVEKKASLLQRILAEFDRTISAFFKIGVSRSFGGSNIYETQYFFNRFGRRIMVIRNGKMHSISGYWEVRHEYDANGFLLRRVLCRKDLAPGDQLIVGDKEVERAYFDPKINPWTYPQDSTYLPN